MRRLLLMMLLLAMTLMPFVGISFAEQESETDDSEYLDYTPTWCQPGWECHKKGTGGWFTLEQLAQIDKKLITLENKVYRLEVYKQRRFGFTAGCGGVVGPTMNSSDPGLSGTLGCGALWGWRF